MKKLFLLAAVTALLVAAFSGTAYANYGIHGGYLQDTDACAGCHRAHTAFSPLTWTDTGGVNQHNALLVNSSTQMSRFCYTCHGNSAPGASTNVQGGVLDTQILGDTYAMGANVNQRLNGGGFDTMGFGTATQTAVLGSHAMETNNSPVWGSGASNATTPTTWSGVFSCNSCHDVHGSSNYRILRDSVNGFTVGGYQGDLSGNTVTNPLPDPWVLSAEVGYPNGDFAGRDTGFKLHKVYPNYKPDYVSAVYHVPPDRNMTGGAINPPTAKGMTGWCIACHENYGDRGTVSGTTPAYGVGGNDDTGYVKRHRHPVNTPLSTFKGPRGLVYDPYVWYNGWDAMYQAGDVTVPPRFIDLPLLHDPALDGREGRYTGGASGIQYSLTDGLDCLTCHRAHGSDATMTGYAASSSNASPQVGSQLGVPPTNDNAILRAPNRGVCERCHNK